MAIRKKKSIDEWQTTDECLGAKLRVTENRCVLFDSFTYIYSALLPQHWALYAKADSTPTFLYTYIYIQFFFSYTFIDQSMVTYIYIYVAIGGKTERLYFLPFKPISWKQACKDESIVSLYFSPYCNIYYALLLCIEHCKTEKSIHRLTISLSHQIYVFMYIYLSDERLGAKLRVTENQWVLLIL